MRALHLKQIGDVWHYQRRRPVEFTDVEQRALIRFLLKTRDFQQAKIIAAEHSLVLEQAWAEAKDRGASLAVTDELVRHAAAASVQKRWGFTPKATQEIGACSAP